MNTKDAAFLTGQNYPGGVPVLAARMGMDASEMNRKLKPSHANGISLDEAEVIMAISGDHRILHALAEGLGYVCIPKPEGEA